MGQTARLYFDPNEVVRAILPCLCTKECDRVTAAPKGGRRREAGGRRDEEKGEGREGGRREREREGREMVRRLSAKQCFSGHSAAPILVGRDEVKGEKMARH